MPSEMKTVNLTNISLDEAIKDQLIKHCHSAMLRRCLFGKKSSASLSSLLEIARSTELANFQAANMENTTPHDHSENTRHLTDSSVREADL